MKDLLSEAPNLYAFVRTVEAGSFSAAARQMETTPSAVSRSVTRAEVALGLRLFLRSTRSLTLTGEGKQLFERVAPLIRQLQAVGEELDEERGLSGRLKISLPGEIARMAMDGLMSSFAKDNPQMNLVVGITDRFVDVVQEGYDVVFRIGHPASSDLIARKLSDMKMVLVASPSFLSRYGAPTTVEELSQRPFVKHHVPGKSFEIDFGDGARIAPIGSIESDTGLGLHIASLAGVGVAYLMECVVADDLKSGRLIQVLPTVALPSLPLSAIHGFGRSVPPRVRAVCDFITGVVRGT